LKNAWTVSIRTSRSLNRTRSMAVLVVEISRKNLVSLSFVFSPCGGEIRRAFSYPQIGEAVKYFAAASVYIYIRHENLRLHRVVGEPERRCT
jgi:hypothetical protein